MHFILIPDWEGIKVPSYFLSPFSYMSSKVRKMKKRGGKSREEWAPDPLRTFTIYSLGKFQVHSTVLFTAVTRCTFGPQTYSWDKRSGWACAGPGSSPSSLGFLVLVGQAPGAQAPTHSLGSAFVRRSCRLVMHLAPSAQKGRSSRP